jgi:hypothetical protein
MKVRSWTAKCRTWKRQMKRARIKKEARGGRLAQVICYGTVIYALLDCYAIKHCIATPDIQSVIFAKSFKASATPSDEPYNPLSQTGQKHASCLPNSRLNETTIPSLSRSRLEVFDYLVWFGFPHLSTVSNQYVVSERAVTALLCTLYIFLSPPPASGRHAVPAPRTAECGRGRNEWA